MTLGALRSRGGAWRGGGETGRGRRCFGVLLPLETQGGGPGPGWAGSHQPGPLCTAGGVLASRLPPSEASLPAAAPPHLLPLWPDQTHSHARPRPGPHQRPPLGMALSLPGRGRSRSRRALGLENHLHTQTLIQRPHSPCQGLFLLVPLGLSALAGLGRGRWVPVSQRRASPGQCRPDSSPPRTHGTGLRLSPGVPPTPHPCPIPGPGTPALPSGWHQSHWDPGRGLGGSHSAGVGSGDVSPALAGEASLWRC